jgi:hypothetical protein
MEILLSGPACRNLSPMRDEPEALKPAPIPCNRDPRHQNERALRDLVWIMSIEDLRTLPRMGHVVRKYRVISGLPVTTGGFRVGARADRAHR